MDGHELDPITKDKASSSYSIDNAIWKKIWSLKTIPRVHNFVWRIINKAVASNDALFKRKCSSSPNCPICEQKEETLEHLFLLCPWVRRSWFASPLGLRISEYDIKSIEEWIEGIMLQSDHNADFVQVYVANHLWSIWKNKEQMGI